MLRYRLFPRRLDFISDLKMELQLTTNACKMTKEVSYLNPRTQTPSIKSHGSSERGDDGVREFGRGSLASKIAGGLLPSLQDLIQGSFNA